MKTTLSMNLMVGRAVRCAPNTRIATSRGAHGVTRRTSFSITLAFCAALALLAHTTLAQTWQTVDDFQYFAGESAGNGALSVLPSGTLLAAGYGYDAATNGHALVMSS